MTRLSPFELRNVHIDSDQIGKVHDTREILTKMDHSASQTCEGFPQGASMLFLIGWGPRPDARVWPGRRVLAAADALLWPAACVCLLLTFSSSTGIVAVLAAAATILVAVRRLWIAVLANHRYVFTTSRWGRLWLTVLLVGVAMKGLLPLMP